MGALVDDLNVIIARSDWYRDGVFNRDLLSQRDSSRVDERDEGGYLRR